MCLRFFKQTKGEGREERTIETTKVGGEREEGREVLQKGGKLFHLPERAGEED